MQKMISFIVNNKKLRGTLIIPKNIHIGTSAVLFIHGWTSSETGYVPRAQVISKLGYVCLTFSMRGHGESEGKLENLSRDDHLKDCIAAYDFLASQSNVDRKKIPKSLYRSAYFNK